jgi:peptidoglycan/LPS O-acetylase OafA/YrhL
VRWTYQPPLDGIRAIAVAAVVAYHLDAGWAAGGYLGVDTFFVLSGFLITTLLLNEYSRERTISLTAFWARRARRLLPALFLVLIAVAIYAAFVADAAQLDSLRGDLFATLFYGANWRFIESGQSYFALFSDASPLRHAWSLAIEEQFYLLWPLIVIGCLRLARGLHTMLIAVCVVGTIVSASVMTILYDAGDPSRAYYGTDGRAQLLLIGALLAIALTHWSPGSQRSRIAVHVAGGVGAAYVLFAMATVEDSASWMYRGGYAVFAIAVAAVIMSVIQPQSMPLRAALSVAPVVWIGRISYGIYLWHWPVIVIMSPARMGFEGIGLTLVRLGVTVGFATLSFYLVELPIREGRFFRSRLALAVSPAAFVATAVVVVLATNGAKDPPRYLESAPTKVIRTEAEVAAASGSSPTRIRRVLLVGDSIATSLQRGLADVASEQRIALSAAAFPGCGVLRGEPVLADGRAIDATAECDRRITDLQVTTEQQVKPELVVWLSVWEVVDRIVDGRQYKPGTPEGDAELAALIEETASRLTAHGARLLIVVPAQATPEAFLPHYTYAEQVTRLAAVHKELAAYAAANPRTTSLIDLQPIVCPGGPPCPKMVDGIELRPDGSHFTAETSRYVAERLVPSFRRELRPHSTVTDAF